MADKLTISSHKELLTEQLKTIAPYLFSEGEINPDLVKQHLLDVEPKQEQYSFNWVGKAKAIKTLQRKTLSLLIPNIGKSINFENTKNVFIEGDNLEILKILQQSYFEEVDLIYIDPPYNTDKDFVYSDKYEDSLQTYLEYAGLIGSSAAFSNETTTGRKHSNWLSMMYPRLVLAKNLLKDTGVIAISIDDNEFGNLKSLCDEIFGSDNFINNFMWLHGKGKKDNFSRTLQQYILIYAKNRKILESQVEWTEIKTLLPSDYDFSNPDNDPKGDWFSGSISFSEERSNKTSKKYYKIVSPSGVEWTRQWQVSEEDMRTLIKNGDVYFGEAPHFKNVPRLKIRPNTQSNVIPNNIIENQGTTKSAENEVSSLFNGNSVFDYPKPIKLLKHLIKITNLNDSSLILDFFAGSGTTGQAIYELNMEDNRNLSYILVQLDEIPTFSNTKKDKEKKEVFNSLGIKFISDLTVERLKRAGKQYPNIDTGFRFFSLPKKLPLQSKDLTSVAELQALELAVKKYSSKEEILTEMLLKRGLLLSSELKKHNDWMYSTTKDDKTVYMCVLEKDICLHQIDEISKTIKDKSKCEVIFIESAFSVEGKLNAINLLEKQQGVSIGLI